MILINPEDFDLMDFQKYFQTKNTNEICSSNCTYEE